MIRKFTIKELQEYNNKQIEEILKYKWIESERLGYDIGEYRASLEWINRHGEQFRKSYFKENSQIS